MKKTTFIIAMFFMLIVLSGTALTEVDTEYETALKYYNSGKYEEAVKHLKEYVQKRPEASVHYLIGYALYKLGKHDEAFKYFDEAYLIDPEFSPMPLEERPVEEVQPEGPRMLGVAPEEPVIQREEITLKEQPVEKIQPEVPQMPVVAPEEPVAQKEEIVPEEKALPEEMPFELPPGFSTEGPVPFEAPEVPTALIALAAGFGIFAILVEIALYIFFSLCLFLIAKKLNVSNAWLAWIPIVNIWIVIKAAGLPWWWLLVLIVAPIPVSFLALLGPAMFFIVFLVILTIYIYPWLLITENLGRNRWLGLLMLVPIANLVLLGILAFSESKKETAPMTPDIT